MVAQSANQAQADIAEEAQELQDEVNAVMEKVKQAKAAVDEVKKEGAALRSRRGVQQEVPHALSVPGYTDFVAFAGVS